MAFLIRLWRVDDQRHPTWRASVQDPHTGERRGFADLKGLATLPMVELNVAAASAVKGPDAVTRVTVGNPSRNLAFFVRLRVLKGKGPAEETEILPVLWQDNYFPLLPGEKREVTAAYRASDLGSSQASVEVSGWNVMRKRL